MKGNAEPVAKAYIHSVWEREEARNLDTNRLERLSQTAVTGKYELGGDGARLVSVVTLNERDEECSLFTNGNPLVVRIEWEGDTKDAEIYSSIRIDSDRMQGVTGFEAFERRAFINGGRPISGRGRIYYRIPRLELGEGRYYLSASICRHMLPKNKEAVLHYLEKVCTFSVRRSVPWHLAWIYEPDVEVRFETMP
jgi:lipopolysaccharide transport system ATP-binding protein